MFLYVAVGSLVVARLLLYPLRPADLTPPYWVAMGAGYHRAGRRPHRRNG